MDGVCDLEREINTARSDLLSDMVSNPDYHCDTKRNGVVQPLLLTRGGEQHSYNVICRPGDEPDSVTCYDEFAARKGCYGTLSGDQYIREFLNR